MRSTQKGKPKMRINQEAVVRRGRNRSKFPLLHKMEERVGERRRVGSLGLPLSSVLSPLLRRGERKRFGQTENAGD
jgi:hypothetical protein